MGEAFGNCKNDIWRPVTLKIIFLVVIALGLVGCGLMVRYGVFGDKVFEGAEGDIIIPEVSTSYCKEVAVKSGNKDTHFTLFVNSGLPKISSKQYVYSSGTSFYIPSWSYQLWRLYLLKGSTVDINICADQYLMFYIIRGEKYHTEWEQTTLFDKYLFKHRVLPQKDCTQKTAFHKHRLKATKDDFYYIMFSSSVGWRFFTHVSVMLMFNRTVYNTSDASYRCHSSNNAQNTCTAPLKYNSKDIVLIEFNRANGEKTPNAFKKDQIKLHPLPREKYYLIFFGGIFGSICCLTMLYSIWRCLAKNIRFKQDKFLLLSVPQKVYSDSTGSKLKAPYRKTTRATLGSFEVVSKHEVEVEDDDDDEEQNLTVNEVHNFGTAHFTNEQVQNSCLTATGISAI